ncbi:MAG: ubiquinol oxidase subunit II [Lautropia sp.]|nr:ubiquinol oxidase subunit II [Lautropia sp.]
MKTATRLRSSLSLLGAAFMAAGCDLVVLNPSGYIAEQEKDLVLLATYLMLLIIVPVICLALFFAWRYRASNVAAKYDPGFHDSIKLEVVLWSLPLIIIITLGIITYYTTHSLDPFKPLQKVDDKREVAAGVEPLDVEVVALDWKWLFIYPKEGIALVNEMAAPVDRPIRFKMTASSVMNTFYVPALAGMIYVMPGMETQLNAVINKPGVYKGLSGNYSGAGFSGMQFKFLGLNNKDYDAWVEKVRHGGGGQLTRADYLQLAKPSANEKVRAYASIDPGLYDRVRLRCVETDRMCSDMIMAIDAQGGLGRLGVDGVVSEAVNQPKHRGEIPVFRSYVSEALCAPLVRTTDLQASSPLALPDGGRTSAVQ